MLPADIEILSLESIGCFEEIPETAATIEGNAILKSDFITRKYGYDCFADDSGLEVQAINGEPGVYSAHYAGLQRSDDDNMNKLLAVLRNESDRNAQFKTVISLNIKGKQHLFTGIAKGEIMREKSGVLGFGYDPIFKPDGSDQTFAQMTLAQKSAIGHRGKAVRQLIDFLQGLR